MTFYDAGTTDDNGNLINYHYQLVQFTLSPSVALAAGVSVLGEPSDIAIAAGLQPPPQAYQEIDANGNIVRFTDMDGNTLAAMPTSEYGVIHSQPPRPSWGS